MTSFVLSSTSSTARSLVNGESAIIGGLGLLSVFTGDAITSTGSVTVMNQGGIAAAGGDAISHTGAAFNGFNSGDVFSTGIAFDVTSTSSVSLSNSGSIQSGAVAIDLVTSSTLS